MIGKLSALEIEEFLASNLVGRIGCHHHALTYVVPISYAYDGVYIYCLSLKGMKLDIMRSNNKVCFQVDVITDMSNWRSVISWGEFEELSSPEDRKKGLSLLTERSLSFMSSVVTHHSPTWPFIEKDSEKMKGIVFRIRLKEKTGRFERTNLSPIFVI